MKIRNERVQAIINYQLGQVNLVSEATANLVMHRADEWVARLQAKAGDAAQTLVVDTLNVASTLVMSRHVSPLTTSLAAVLSHGLPGILATRERDPAAYVESMTFGLAAGAAIAAGELLAPQSGGALASLAALALGRIYGTRGGFIGEANDYLLGRRIYQISRDGLRAAEGAVRHCSRRVMQAIATRPGEKVSDSPANSAGASDAAKQKIIPSDLDDWRTPLAETFCDRSHGSELSTWIDRCGVATTLLNDSSAKINQMLLPTAHEHAYTWQNQLAAMLERQAEGGLPPEELAALHYPPLHRIFGKVGADDCLSDKWLSNALKVCSWSTEDLPARWEKHIFVDACAEIYKLRVRSPNLTQDYLTLMMSPQLSVVISELIEHAWLSLRPTSIEVDRKSALRAWRYFQDNAPSIEPSSLALKGSVHGESGPPKVDHEAFNRSFGELKAWAVSDGIQTYISLPRWIALARRQLQARGVMAVALPTRMVATFSDDLTHRPRIEALLDKRPTESPPVSLPVKFALHHPKFLETLGISGPDSAMQCRGAIATARWVLATNRQDCQVAAEVFAEACLLLRRVYNDKFLEYHWLRGQFRSPSVLYSLEQALQISKGTDRENNKKPPTNKVFSSSELRRQHGCFENALKSEFR